ncbi:MAG TPA: hypothetical protein VGL40_01160, partial [Bacillota bacterium]
MVAIEVACLELRQVVDQCVVPLSGRFALPVPVGTTIHCVPTPLGMVPGTLSISGPFISPVAEGVYSVSSEISARFSFAIQCSPSLVIVEERLSFPLAVLLNLDRLTGVDVQIEVTLDGIACFLCPIGPGRQPGELRPLSRLDGERGGDQLGYAVGLGPFGPPGPGKFLAGAPSAGPGGVADAGSL